MHSPGSGLSFFLAVSLRFHRHARLYPLRESYRKRSSLPFHATERDGAVMLFHNAARNHQTDTRTGFLKVHGILGSIIFVKNIALLLFRNADTRILHFNSPLLSCSLHQYVNDPLLCILQGIGEQIVYDMIHLLPVNPNLGHIRLHLQLYPDALLHGS